MRERRGEAASKWSQFLEWVGSEHAVLPAMQTKVAPALSACAQQEKEDAILFNPAVKKKLEAAARKKKEAEEAAAAAAAAEGPEIMTAEEAYLDAKRDSELARAEAVLGMQQDDDVLDQIERERTELRKQGGLTPVTFDSFVAWKAKKAEERKAQELQDTKNAIAVSHTASAENIHACPKA